MPFIIIIPSGSLLKHCIQQITEEPLQYNYKVHAIERIKKLVEFNGTQSVHCKSREKFTCPNENGKRHEKVATLMTVVHARI